MAALAVTLLGLPGCIQPGSIDDFEADAAPGGNNDEPDAEPNDNPNPNPGTPDAAPPQGGELTFTADVYPILQSSGKGCANCHGAGGIAAFLPMNDGAEAVFGRLDNGARINKGAPADSLVLTKPLENSGVGHPVKLYPSTDDASYKIILEWISGGAPL